MDQMRSEDSHNAGRMDKMAGVFVFTRMMGEWSRALFLQQAASTVGTCGESYVAPGQASDVFLSCLRSSFIPRVDEDVASSKMKVLGTVGERGCSVVSFIHLTNVLSVLTTEPWIVISHREE